MAEYVTVGRAEDVAEGEVRAFSIQGEDVSVANVGGTHYAVSDVCTHAQCSLAEGELEGHQLICPCHGSEFDVRNGEVLNPPATVPLETYAVRDEDGELQVEV